MGIRRPMARKFDVSALTIVYAEDDLVFREIAVPAIIKVGVPEKHILVAEDGQGALDHLLPLQGGDVNSPILLILDVRMPGMDGNECAQKVKELNDAGKLRRMPFLVCCSAGVEQVSFGGKGEGSEIFQITMPKPFSDKEVKLVLEKAEEWWMSGSGSAPEADPAWVRTLDIICGDQEPICRMALMTLLTTQGADAETVHECDDEDEVIDALTTAQGGDKNRPLVVFLSNTSWAGPVKKAATSRVPFIISTSVDAERDADACNAALPRQCSQADLKLVLDRCRAWWSKR